MHSPLFKSFFVTLLLVGFWNAVAFYFHLFTAINNFDMTFHFLGGFFVVISVLTILTNYKTDFSYGQLLFYGIASAFIIGILWECFELYFGITYWGTGFWPSMAYIADNGMDVTMDVTGGLFAVWYSYFKLKIKN